MLRSRSEEGWVSASSSSALCSEHFKPEDFDRTGQTVRIRDGAIPSVLSFPAHLQKPVSTRTTKTSKKAEEALSVDCSQLVQDIDEPLRFNVDHSYALPSSSNDLMARVIYGLDRVESLERDKRNAMARERRPKDKVCSVLEELKRKSLNKLDSYSESSHQYSKDQREFSQVCLCPLFHAVSLVHFVCLFLLRCDYAATQKPGLIIHELCYLDLLLSLHRHLWMSSVNAKPGLNMTILDML
ncbi:hypothetical protein AMECASPLE_000384 [Ameca splendens]|uniref:THAP-type domain-containing protein n=1 Tax=Ameca splendens TaxID=208324 RepID=A0ABV0XLU8_9TELE